MEERESGTLCCVSSVTRPTESPVSSPATTPSVPPVSRAAVSTGSSPVPSAGMSPSTTSPGAEISLYRKVTSLRDGHSTPPTDSLLRFLVESSCDEYPKCANCDRNEKTPMFFCNTCGEQIDFLGLEHETRVKQTCGPWPIWLGFRPICQTI